MGGIINLTGVPDFDRLEVVKESTTSVSSTGDPVNWTTVAHGLGYTPQIIAFLNNISITSGSPIVTNGDMPLPTWAGLSVSGGVVQFTKYVNAVTDGTNAYFFLFNGTGSAVSALTIKYYLLRKRSR